ALPRRRGGIEAPGEMRTDAVCGIACRGGDLATISRFEDQCSADDRAYQTAKFLRRFWSRFRLAIAGPGEGDDRSGFGPFGLRHRQEPGATAAFADCLSPGRQPARIQGVCERPLVHRHATRRLELPGLFLPALRPCT